MFRKEAMLKNHKTKLIEKLRQNNVTSLTITQFFDTKLKENGSEHHQFLLALKENFSLKSISIVLPETDKEVLGHFLFDLLIAIKNKETISDFQCYDIRDEDIFAMIMMGISTNQNIVSFKITGTTYSPLLKNLICYHPSLESVTTSELNDEDSKILTLGLKGNKNLNTLRLFNSDFQQDGYAYLLQAALENPKITTLSFIAGKQILTQKQMVTIVDLLIKNKTLRELAFDFTVIAPEAISELNRLFKENLSLTKISLFSCQLNKSKLDEIKVALLSDNACEREVNLSWNNQQIISDVTTYPAACRNMLSTEEATQLLAKLSLEPSIHQTPFFITNNNASNNVADKNIFSFKFT